MNRYFFLACFALTALSTYAEKSCCAGKKNQTHKKCNKSSLKKTLHDVASRSEFDKKLTEASHVIVEFYAPWCPSCQKMKPIFEKVASEHAQDKNLLFVQADVEKNDINAIADKLGIQGIPTLVFYINGEVVDTKVGALSEEALQVTVEQFMKKSGKKSTPKQEKKQPQKPVVKSEVKKEEPQVIQHQALGSQEIKSLADYEQKMLDKKPIVLLITAPAWCGACQMFEPTFEAAAHKHAHEINFYWINADNKELNAVSRKEAPQGYPTTVFIKNGKKSHSIVGAYPENKFEQEIQKILK